LINGHRVAARDDMTYINLWRLFAGQNVPLQLQVILEEAAGVMEMIVKVRTVVTTPAARGPTEVIYDDSLY